MKRLLTTSPGSATPDLVVAYNPETGNSEVVLITHVVPTVDVPPFDYDEYRRFDRSWVDGTPGFNSF